MEGDRGQAGGVTIAIEDPIGCPRLLGAVLRDVKVAPSPAWLRRRIEAVGMRSINNVVDATNYVMFELNQPMHAYDVAKLHGPAVIARRARPGERLVTLDGVSPAADRGHDGDRRRGQRHRHRRRHGGGAREVSAETTDVLLECAYFDPARIRRTRRTLDLSTEASYRFERGVDRWAGAEALRRCIEVILATAGGSLTDSRPTSGPQPTTPPRIFLRPARVAQVLGVEFPVSVLERYLVAIGATVLSKPDAGRLRVDVPGWRPDLTPEIDLVEEIARLHGYDRFPEALRPFRPTQIPERPAGSHLATVRHGLISKGLYEIASLPAGGAGGRATAFDCSTRSPPKRVPCAVGCCPAWCGRSRPIGRSGCATFGCSRSGPCSRPETQGPGPTKRGTWPASSPGPGSRPTGARGGGRPTWTSGT